MSDLTGSAGLVVHCAYTDIMALDALIPHPRNPNTHPDEQLRMLAKIMMHQGWRNPIVVSRRSGFIIKGHGRLAAARINGWEHAVVDRQDYATETEEWADMVADNRIAELAVIDVEIMRGLVDNLGDGFDPELLGFGEIDLASFISATPAEGLGATEINENEFQDFAHACPRCGFEFDKPVAVTE